MAQKAKVSISISALFEPGQGFVLDATCIVFRTLFTFITISNFVFVIGFYSNLVGDLCKTCKLDFLMQWGVFYVLYFVSLVYSLHFVFPICIWVLFEPVGGFVLDRTWEKKQV